MKNIFKKSLILLVILLFVQGAQAKFRDVNSTDYNNLLDEIPAPVEFASGVSTIETVNAIKDNNEKLYGVVGKSQVLTFDKNIKRVSLASDEIADIVVVSPKQIMINGKKAGNTSMVFWSENSDKPVFYNLVIQQDTDPFVQAVEHVAPNENISVLFNDTGAVLTGHISSTTVKEKITNLAKAYGINLTDLTESPTKQVLLEVKITEASKNFSRNLGVNVTAGRALKLETGKVNVGGWQPLAENPLGYNNGVIQTSGGLLSAGFWKVGRYIVDFEASEAKGDIKILAEPKLLAVNGQEGSFTVGNQVPVPSSVGNYGNVAYEYKDSGVVLKFTPTIMEESNRVRLKLNPEISEIDSEYSTTSSLGGTVYGFKTRKVETTVELMDGETLVIAGLIQNNSSKNKSQVPILGNIPVLGALFSTTADRKNNNEVIIFITPRIVDNSVNIDSL